MTVLEHIITSLRAAAAYNQHDSAPPSVILWTDSQRLWEPVAGRIGECLERFYILNPEEAGQITGPSTWIRYRLTADAHKEGIPVIYLPGISRQAFRSPAGFPEGARHLYALQFLGQFWTQLNAKDWTPAALLSSAEGGLGLDLAKDNSTTYALATQLASVLDSPVASLQGKRLEAADFNAMAAHDPAGMLLRWLCDPAKAWQEWPAEKRTAFQQICQEQYSFSPSADGRLGAAERLIAGGPAWDAVWQRFEEAPATYAGVKDALALVQPVDLFMAKSPRLPKANQEEEDRLRQALMELPQKTGPGVPDALIALAGEHSARALSVWAALGESPLAHAAVHLGRMATALKASLPGMDWPGLAAAWLETGWKADAEARHSYAAVRAKPDTQAVTAALQAAYLPWLAKLADRTAPWSYHYPNSSPATARHLKPDPGTVYLFVDGLRADLALELSALLEAAGKQVASEIGWSTLPSVTATAKPAWQPLAGLLAGKELSETFEPQLAADGKPLTTDAFRKSTGKAGLPWFSSTETGNPGGSGWTEAGDFDSRGHKEGAKLAWRIQEELDAVHQRITELLTNGWNKVVVVTDHGFLWMPGSLPKTALTTHLTVSKWGRCAVPQAGAQHHLPQVPWFWGNQHTIVLAPGITAFRENVEYSHGGLTLQETLILALTVTHSHVAGLPAVAITLARWRGLRLQVEVQGTLTDCALDLRLKAADASTSLLEKKAVKSLNTPGGKVALVITNDDHTGAAAMLVVLYHGEVVAKCPVVIGEN